MNVRYQTEIFLGRENKLIYNIVVICVLAYLLSKDTLRLINPQEDIDAVKFLKEMEEEIGKEAQLENGTGAGIESKLMEKAEQMKPASRILSDKLLLFACVFSYIPISIFAFLVWLVYELRNAFYMRNKELKKSTVRIFAAIPQAMALLLFGACFIFRQFV